MDATELLDDMDRFENEFEMVTLAGDVALAFESVPMSPWIAESVVWRMGRVEYVLGGDVASRKEFWTEA